MKKDNKNFRPELIKESGMKISLNPTPSKPATPPPSKPKPKK